MNYLVVVVENDVAFSIKLPVNEEARDLMVSALMSNPKFIPYDKDLVYGSEWDGEKFSVEVERPIYTGPMGQLGDRWDGEKFIKGE